MQRAGNLAGCAIGTENERKEDRAEENEEMNITQLERNPVEKATGEVETIFRGGNGWSN